MRASANFLNILKFCISYEKAAKKYPMMETQSVIELL